MHAFIDADVGRLHDCNEDLTWFNALLNSFTHEVYKLWCEFPRDSVKMILAELADEVELGMQVFVPLTMALEASQSRVVHPREKMYEVKSKRDGVLVQVSSSRFQEPMFWSYQSGPARGQLR